MKNSEHEKQLREDFEAIKDVARYGSLKLTQMVSFLEQYEKPENFAEKGLECALRHIQSQEIDSVESIVGYLKRNIKEYRDHRKAYLKEHYSDEGAAKKDGWRIPGEDYPMFLEFLKEK